MLSRYGTQWKRGVIGFTSRRFHLSVELALDCDTALGIQHNTRRTFEGMRRRQVSLKHIVDMPTRVRVRVRVRCTRVPHPRRPRTRQRRRPVAEGMTSQASGAAAARAMQWRGESFGCTASNDGL